MPAAHATTLNRRTIQPLLRLALREDRADRDVTSRAAIPSAQRIRARIIAKASGVLAGGPVAAWTFLTQDPSLRCRLACRDGAAITKGKTILTVEGRARSVFAAERTALNLLGHLSGVATVTRAFVRRAGPRVEVLDTRKTLPGLRGLEKYAVRTGGGHSHRMSLQDAVLIKTNHLRAFESEARWRMDGAELIQRMIRQAKAVRPKRFVEIEVTDLRELDAALRARPDAVLLDNWRAADIKNAVALRNAASRRRRPLLEVSGGVTLANVGAIARTGVERISIGRLTHSAPSLDLALRVE